MNRGATYDDLTEYEKAIRDYDRALKIREELDREGRLPDRNGLAGVLINRGNTHRSLTEYQKAVDDHDRALKIMELFDPEGRPPDRNYLATVLMNRGIAYSGLTEYQKAVGDYDRALASEKNSTGRPAAGPQRLGGSADEPGGLPISRLMTRPMP